MTDTTTDHHDDTTTTTTTSGQPTIGRLGVVGLVVLGLTPAAMFVIGLVSGMPLEEGIFFVIAAAVLLAGAAVAPRFGTWGRIVGLVATTLGALALFWLVFGLAFPASPADFVPAIAFVAGLALSLIGNIGAIVSSRRPAAAVQPARVRGALTATFAVIGLAAVGSIVLALATGSQVEATAAADADASVTMDAYAFAEGNYRVPAGQTSIVVRNTDAWVHDIAIPGLGVDARTLSPGDEVLVSFDAAPGQYTIYCTLHADTDIQDPDEAGMAATLIVDS